VTKKNPKNVVEERPEPATATTVEPSAVDAPVEAGFSRPEDRPEDRPGTDEPSLAERERDEYKDLLLRKTAEFDNFRRRTDRERQALSDTAAAGIIEELLPLVDDLERALSADPKTEGSDAYRKGVELIHRQLQEILRRRGVTPVEALGVEFDPHYHQAVSYEPSDRPEGEIIEEFRRGYMLRDRLLRPSMVKVAKG
jgi:molecular chaperone GrpE